MNIDKNSVNKVLGIAGAAIAAFMAFNSNMADQKREKEFNDMKKYIDELKNKDGNS